VASAGIHGVSAAAAGTIATIATHPFDVIKVFRSLYHHVCFLIGDPSFFFFADKDTSTFRRSLPRLFENSAYDLGCRSDNLAYCVPQAESLISNAVFLDFLTACHFVCLVKFSLLPSVGQFMNLSLSSCGLNITGRTKHQEDSLISSHYSIVRANDYTKLLHLTS